MPRKEEKYPTFTTPRGVLVYPHLNKARDYKQNKKFAYDTDFLLEGADAQELIRRVDELHEESVQEHGTRPADKPYKPHTDDDGGEIEGAFRFHFKVAAQVKTRSGEVWDRRPALFDRYGRPVTTFVGGGSVAQIKFQAYKWNTGKECGVTLQPVAVMIFDLVEFDGSKSARDFGFKTETPPEGEADFAGGTGESTSETQGATGADF